MISLTINGQTIEVEEGTTVLQAAESAVIHIPTLCYHKDLTPYGSCRLCVVELQGARHPSTSCDLLATQGMVIQTESPKISRYRRAVLKALLFAFYDAGYTRFNGTAGLDVDTQFAGLVKTYGIDMKSAMARGPLFPVDSDPNPFVWVDMNKCILCTRCVRACAEVQGRFVWVQAYRGSETRIVPGAETSMLQGRCESCGACVAYCPTGALDNKMSVTLGRPDRLVTTTCPYCGVGCQFDLNVRDDVPGGRVLRVTSNPEAPVNGMHLCVKGRYGYDFIHRPDRLLKPMVRRYLLEEGRKTNDENNPSSFVLRCSSEWVEVDWDIALNIAAKRFRETLAESGPASIGLITSGRCLNEENYLLNKLARQVLRTNNIDLGARLDNDNTGNGLFQSFGLNAMTNSLDDIAEHARSVLVIGSDLTEQQPVFGAKIRQAVLRRGTRLVVASPGLTNIAEYSKVSLRHKPGTEVALLNGLMKIILDNGWENRKFIDERTEGFEELRSVIGQYTPDLVSAITDIPMDKLCLAAETLAKNQPVAVICGAGVSQHLIMNLSNLQMVLGNLGIPGGGVNPLHYQNNTQGACDMGGLPDFYPGYQAVVDPEIRQKFEAAWGTTLPEDAGMTASEMLAAAGEGELKTLYIVNEDPLSNGYDSSVRRCLEKCNFIILQEIFPSRASSIADVILPGVSFAEKTGTFTNTERRIQMVRQAIQPLGEARPDWQIISDLASRILADSERSVIQGEYAGWEYGDPSQIMVEIAALAPIYAGVSLERLERKERLQWPIESQDKPGTPIMYVERFPCGLGRFMPVEHLPEDKLPT